MNTIITINAGSSSFKLNIFHGLECVASYSTHTQDELIRLLPKEAPFAIGHRVVHGGNAYKNSVVIDDKVLKNLEDLSELAPLHNGLALEIIKRTRNLYGSVVPQVAVFDTAFFADLPQVAQKYALPIGLTDKYGIRRFGFHGISHAFLSKQLNKEKVLTLHLGSGASIAALLFGKPIDTSMGFTPNEGLVMGTRSGDLNPDIVQYLSEKESVAAKDILDMCNHKAGLLGLSGVSANMQDLLAQYDKSATAAFAIDLFCYRIVSYIGSYLAHLQGLDAIIFSGGIGENAALIRSLIINRLQWYGIYLDTTRNENPGSKQKISADNSSVEVWVIPSNEALEIAQNINTLIHELHCAEPWYSLIKNGIKPVEGRKNSPKYQGIKAGDVIKFTYGVDHFFVRVTEIRKYASLEAYLSDVTVEKALPGVSSLADACRIYHEWSTPQEINQFGFLGIFVEKLNLF